MLWPQRLNYHWNDRKVGEYYGILYYCMEFHYCFFSKLARNVISGHEYFKVFISYVTTWTLIFIFSPLNLFDVHRYRINSAYVTFMFVLCIR